MGTADVDVEDLARAAHDLAEHVSLAADSGGRIVWLDAAAERLFGSSVSDLAGRPLDELLPGLDPSSIGSVPNGFPDLEARRLDGSRIPVAARALRTRGGYVVVSAWRSDTGDRRFRESREMLQAVADSTKAVIYIKDADGCYIFVNRRYEELFNVRNAWMRGKTDYDLFSREIADALRANDAAVCARGEAIEFDETVFSGGEPRQYLSIKVPLRGPDGEVYAVCGVSTDITERKRTEQALLQTYDQLRRLVADQSSDLSAAEERHRRVAEEKEALFLQLSIVISTAREGIWTIDLEGRTTFVNPRIAEMLGYAAEEMQGRSALDFVAPAARQAAEQALARFRRGVGEDLEIELRRKDGSPLWVLISVSPIRNRDGQLLGTLGMLSDFTERKKADERQRRLTRELDHRVKNTLALVTALADLTMSRAASLDAFRDSFRARIQALARTHEALASAGWSDIGFDEVVALVLAPQTGLPDRKVSLFGPPVRIAPSLVTPLALALNELATNALKHGALAASGGEVAVEWALGSDGVFSLTWRERSARPREESDRQGAGLPLLRGLVEHELGGTIDSVFEASGFRCTVAVPMRGHDAVAGGSERGSSRP